MILAAAAALVLSAACTKVEVTSSLNDEPQAIGFTSYTPRPLSKAATATYVDGTTNSNLVNGTTFGVYAWATTQSAVNPWGSASVVLFDGSGAPGFMSNIPVTFKGDVNTGSGNVSAEGYYSTGNAVRYWPSGDKPDALSFFAYYPHQANTSNGITLPANGLGATAVTVKDAPADQIDFMVAPVVADQWYEHTNVSSSGKNNTVKFTFKHTLTKVRFYFNTDNTDSNTEVKLTNATLSGVYKTNTLTTSYTKGSAVNSGTFTYTWGNTPSNAGDFNITVDGATLAATNRVLSATQDTACELGDNFMMIPQTISAGQQKLNLTWTVTTAGVTTTNTKTIDLADIVDSSSNTIDWAMNLQVKYVITIGPKPIYFIAEVTPWTAEETGTISVN